MRIGSLWSHGKRTTPRGYRWWGYFRSQSLFHVEAHALQWRCSVGLRVGGDESDLGGHFCVPLLFSLYWSARLPGFLHARLPTRTCIATWENPAHEFTLPDPRRVELSFSDWTLRLVLWGRDMEWRSADPWYVRGVHLDLLDALFGPMTTTTKEVEVRPALVPMPEGCYRATVTISKREWRRPRWPLAWRRDTHAHVEIPRGIPHAGKGENSYDCGDDATYGSSFPARCVEEAIGSVVGHALRDRARYGASSDSRDSRTPLAPRERVGIAS